MAKATSLAGAFFSRYTMFWRFFTSAASSIRSIASTTIRSLAVPDAMMLLVRGSASNRKGTSELSVSRAAL